MRFPLFSAPFLKFLMHFSEFVKAWIGMSSEQAARYKACCLHRFWEWCAITNIEMHFVLMCKILYCSPNVIGSYA